jgi:hypothetical protein
MLAKDSKALRNYIKSISPDVDMVFTHIHEDGETEVVPITMGVGFFGLPKNHSLNLHTQIFEMVNYGNGFTVMDLYKMPTHLRNFYYNKLVDAKKKENQQVETANKASKVRIKR